MGEGNTSYSAKTTFVQRNVNSSFWPNFFQLKYIQVNQGQTKELFDQSFKTHTLKATLPPHPHQGSSDGNIFLNFGTLAYILICFWLNAFILCTLENIFYESWSSLVNKSHFLCRGKTSNLIAMKLCNFCYWKIDANRHKYVGNPSIWHKSAFFLIWLCSTSEVMLTYLYRIDN